MIRWPPRLRAPAFWSAAPGVGARLLKPASVLVEAVAARRRARVGERVSVPVLCCGNLTAGGAGKTTLVLDLGARLRERGVAVHFLTRGYGRKPRARDTGANIFGRGVPEESLLVDPDIHNAADVGDEALLLARIAPCWVGADRVRSARAAIAAGATCLVMDDGFQNPGLHKDLALLVIDGASGLGNGRVIPAGPLRENPEAGLAAADVVVVTGEDRVGVRAWVEKRSPRGMPVLRAWPVMEPSVDLLRGRPVVAFAGLARPSKFFRALRERGVVPLRAVSFPDHYAYRRQDLARLARIALRLDATLVTTPKDAVRLPAYFRRHVTVVGVELAWADPDAPESLLDRWLEREVTAR
nr:tetraacyldisaccharide 4'-kinase [Acetobacter sp. DsW_063]